MFLLRVKSCYVIMLCFIVAAAFLRRIENLRSSRMDAECHLGKCITGLIQSLQLLQLKLVHVVFERLFPFSIAS
jgi:hypothetical protein